MLAPMLVLAVLTPGNAYHVSRLTSHVQPPIAAQVDTTDLVGTWDGLFNSAMMGQGGMKLVVSKRAEWKATVTLTRDESMSAEAGNFKVQGKELSWSLDLHGMTCESTAVVEGLVLKGETSCGGEVAFTFELRKIP
jgi:hypothetical protein